MCRLPNTSNELVAHALVEGWVGRDYMTILKLSSSKAPSSVKEVPETMNSAGANQAHDLKHKIDASIKTSGAPSNIHSMPQFLGTCHREKKGLDDKKRKFDTSPVFSSSHQVSNCHAL